MGICLKVDVIQREKSSTEKNMEEISDSTFMQSSEPSGCSTRKELAIKLGKDDRDDLRRTFN